MDRYAASFNAAPPLGPTLELPGESVDAPCELRLDHVYSATTRMPGEFCCW
jgi:hypothetical protein